jgi:integrase
MLISVYSFYDFHQRNSGIPGFDGYEKRMLKNPKYKPFLHGIRKQKATRTRVLKLKETKTFPGCLSSSDIKVLIDNCSLIRDKFLLTLLYESGIRIGEALGLRHEDLASSGENKIYIQPRTHNSNGARVKNQKTRTIHVSKELMKLYSIYLVEEYPEEIDCDYVFVNVKRNIGSPLKVSNVHTLFNNLQKKTGIKVHPHLFRHTHATELIRAGWNMALVQKRLGHANVQTTSNTYLHLSDQDMKEAYQSFMETKENNGSY